MVQCARTLAGILCQRMYDHRTDDRRGRPDERRREVLFDPREPASVRLLRSRMVVEDADRRHRVVRRIDHIIGHETFDITDDRNGTLLDPACQLFGHASLCFALTNGGVHGLLLQRRAARGRDCRDHASRSKCGGARAAGFPRIPNPTPFPATTPWNWPALRDRRPTDQALPSSGALPRTA